jgi:hypothetical protein
MKLSRPDVFHPRIVLASCRRSVDGDFDGADLDDAGLIGALRRRGLFARLAPWDDPQTEKADLVILRAVSDLAERREEFLAWTTRVPNLLNAPAVMAWNSGQDYLGDLAAAGVPVCPRADICSGNRDPRPGNRTALVYLAGEQSHAFADSPAGSSAAGTSIADGLSQVDPDFDVWDLGYRVLDAACARLGIPGTDLLYARVDLIGRADASEVRELDLIAPDLGWRHLDERTRTSQQRRFALGVESACERLGLGPLSRRGPLSH